MSGRHRKAGPPSDAPEALDAAQVAQPLAQPRPAAQHAAPVPEPEPAAVPVGASVGAPPPAAPVPVVAVPPVPVTPSAPFAAPVGTGSAAEGTPVLPVGASARRAAREEQKRRSRRSHLLVVGAVVVVALLVIGGAVKLLTGGAPAPAAKAPVARPQTTLLMQVVDARRQTLAAVLLGHDSRNGGVGFGALVPSSLAVDSTGSSGGTFGTTAASGGQASAIALGDLIGVDVDGTWVLDTTGLATVVDKVGGVDVDVDRDVTVPVAGGTQTLAAAGHQHLGGSAAAAYATFLAPQEPEQSRLARFAAVMTALVPKLPSDSAQRAALLTSLGIHSTSTDSASALDGFLGSLRSDAAANRLSFDTVPTHSLDLGTGTPTLLLDPTPAQAMVNNNFSGALLPTRAGGPIRVVIENGVGTPGLGGHARTKLLAAGLSYVNGGNATKFGYPKSLVLVPTGAGAAGLQQGQVVARALGLPASDVATTDQGQTIADVVVILGADFKP